MEAHSGLGGFSTKAPVDSSLSWNAGQLSVYKCILESYVKKLMGKLHKKVQEMEKSS